MMVLVILSGPKDDRAVGVNFLGGNRRDGFFVQQSLRKRNFDKRNIDDYELGFGRSGLPTIIRSTMNDEKHESPVSRITGIETHCDLGIPEAVKRIVRINHFVIKSNGVH